MDRYRSVWTTARGTRRFLAVTLAVAVAHTLVVVLFSVTALAHALAVPLAVLLGPAAVLGVALGAVVYELAAVGLNWHAIVLFVDLFVCAALGRELWNALPNNVLGRPTLAVLWIIPVAVVAALVGFGLAVVLSAIVADFGVAAVLPVLAGERVLLAAVVAPVVLAVGYLWRAPEVDDTENSFLRWTGTVAVVGIIAAGWLAGTAVFNLVRRDARTFPEVGDAIVDAVPSPADLAVAFTLGAHGWVTYLVGTLVALVLVSLVLRVGLSWSPSAR